MRSKTVYDIAAVGIGPFNLGLAALCYPIKNLKTILIDQKPEFDWHGGMMIPGTTLQVPYLADLVTLADPSSKFSYLSFLRNQNRLLQFGIHEKSYITGSEYNRYCRWVCGRLNNVLFGHCVKSIVYVAASNLFEISIQDVGKVKQEILTARHIVIGVGTKPHIPPKLAQHLGDRVIHSSGYLYRKKDIMAAKKIAVIGSGQSAAEIFYDLLNKVELAATKLNWYTRSDRFYAMERGKLNYEMTSPDYIDFFYNLDPGVKESLLRLQFSLYKGINHGLIEAIYDRLYELLIENEHYHIQIGTHSELQDITPKSENEFELAFYHNAQKKNFKVTSDFVILATGYENRIPHLLRNVKAMLQLDRQGRYQVNRNYSIDQNNRIFAQNAEMHTHGFNTPDLGLGAYRNAVIINSILKEECYPVDHATSFQSFGVL